MWYDAYAMQGPCGEMEFDPEFVQKSMIEQLGKITDSARVDVGIDVPKKKFKPVNTVITDDGKKIRINAKEAQTIIDAVVNVPAPQRLDVLKKIQSSPGLKEVLEIVRKM
jgi:hypothetical protein